MGDVHTDSLDAWEHIAQICDDVMQLGFLGWSASIGRVSALVQTAFVADTDAVVVVTFAMVSWLGEQNVLGDCSVLSDIEMERNVLMAFVYGTNP